MITFDFRPSKSSCQKRGGRKEWSTVNVNLKGQDSFGWDVLKPTLDLLELVVFCSNPWVAMFHHPIWEVLVIPYSDSTELHSKLACRTWGFHDPLLTTCQSLIHPRLKKNIPNKLATFETQSHRIHGTGIFPYMVFLDFFMVNVYIEIPIGK